LKLGIYPAQGEEGSPFFGWHSKLPASVRTRDMATFMTELDRAHVRHAVAWGRRVTRMPEESTANADIAALVTAHPGRFSGFGGVSMPDDNDIRTAMAAVDDALVTHRLKGITLEPGTYKPLTPVDDRRLYPVYERCSELGGILALTMSRTRDDEATLANASPIGTDHVARDFPELKIVVSHAYWPWPELSIGLAFRRRNVYLVPDMYGAGMPGYEHWVEAANTFMGERLIFGSAYPLLGVEEMVKSYLTLGFEDRVIENVMRTNAARLLGLA
jgi:predicted TIM-barrel fold metal-dependent hydrolase